MKPKRFLSVLCVALLLLIGCSNSKKQLEQYDLGIRFLNEANYEEAILAFKSSIEIDPYAVKPYAALASTYLLAGEYDNVSDVWSDAAANTDDSVLQDIFESQGILYDDIRENFGQGGQNLWITGLTFDKETFLSGAETEFRFTVLYQIEDGQSLPIKIFGNLANQESWDIVAQQDSPITGTGIVEIVARFAPPQWENRNLRLSAQMDMSSSQTIYITHDGVLTNAYAPTNKYGAVQFEYRLNYRPFDTLGTTEQQFIDTLASLVSAQDQGAIEALYESGIPTIPANGSLLTIWNDYKIEIISYEQSSEGGGRQASIHFMMRPESGIGYDCDIYFGDSPYQYDETFDVTTMGNSFNFTSVLCQCEDWLWNGDFTEIIFDHHYMAWQDDGSTLDEIRSSTTTGTMKNGLRDGTFTGESHIKSVWSAHPDLNQDSAIPFVRVYQNGTLVQSIYDGSDSTTAEKVGETPYSVWSTGSIMPIELNPDMISNLNALYW